MAGLLVTSCPAGGWPLQVAEAIPNQSTALSVATHLSPKRTHTSKRPVLSPHSGGGPHCPPFLPGAGVTGILVNLGTLLAMSCVWK